MTDSRTEYRVVDRYGLPYPDLAAPLTTLDRALLRVKHYESISRVSGEARMPDKPLRVECRTVVIGDWLPISGDGEA